MFLSERRAIRNTLLRWLDDDWEVFPLVAREYYVPHQEGKRGPIFNRDFSHYLADPEAFTEFESFLAPVLPNTMGAEVFVTIDKDSRQPLLVRLLAGEAIPLRYFKRFVSELEQEMATLGSPLAVSRCRECRIFVIGGEICFLCFLTSEQRAYDFAPRSLRSDASAEIVAYYKDEQLVCVDGWLKTTVPQSDRYLIAEPR